MKGYCIADLISPLLAIIIIAGGLILMYLRPDMKTEIVGLMVIVLSFYFGSSKGSQSKDTTISTVLKNKENNNG